jgi:hypothetical protein
MKPWQALCALWGFILFFGAVGCTAHVFSALGL